MRRFLPALALLAAASPALARETLCRADETPVFSCPTRGSAKIVSLCASAGLSESAGSLTYRFGRPGRIELAYPQEGGPAKAFFRNGIIGAGGGDFVRFTQRGTTYTIEHADGPRSGQYAGLTIHRGAKPLGEIRCKGSPYEALGPRGFAPVYAAKLPSELHSLD